MVTAQPPSVRLCARHWVDAKATEAADESSQTPPHQGPFSGTRTHAYTLIHAPPGSGVASLPGGPELPEFVLIPLLTTLNCHVLT